MKKTAATIVFDLDGTLVDTAPDLVNALNAALALEGVDEPISLVEARALIGAGARALIARGLSARNKSVADERFNELHRAFLDHYEDHICDESQAFPGMEQALDELTQGGYRLSVCTNKSERLAVKLLDRMGLLSRFATVVGGDTLSVQKPDPQPLVTAIEQAGGTGAPAIMVGDSATDVFTARNAGIPVVGVTFGYTDIAMRDLAPDRLIEHFDDLADAVQQLLGVEVA